MISNRRRTRRSPTGISQGNVINRGELPIVLRGDEGGRAGVRRLVLLLILGIGGWILTQAITANSVSHRLREQKESVLSAEPGFFRVDSLVVTNIPSGITTSWRVGGAVVNLSAQTRKAPQVRVRLQRRNGTTAAETLAVLPETVFQPGQEMPFRAKLESRTGEQVEVDVALVPPGDEGHP